VNEMPTPEQINDRIRRESSASYRQLSYILDTIMDGKQFERAMKELQEMEWREYKQNQLLPDNSLEAMRFRLKYRRTE